MSKMIGTALKVSLTISALLLGGCGTVRERLVVKVVCPQLDSPTMRIIQGFEDIGTKDEDSAKWVVKLDEHYQKLDKCKPRVRR